MLREVRDFELLTTMNLFHNIIKRLRNLVVWYKLLKTWQY